MLTKDNFTLEHIADLKKNRMVDSFILERSIYAFGLLEALCKVEMPFIFKGGTSLMLLLEKPRQLSTDIDIIVAPGTNVDHYLEEAGKIFRLKKSSSRFEKGKTILRKDITNITMIRRSKDRRHSIFCWISFLKKITTPM